MLADGSIGAPSPRRKTHPKRNGLSWVEIRQPWEEHRHHGPIQQQYFLLPDQFLQGLRYLRLSRRVDRHAIQLRRRPRPRPREPRPQLPATVSVRGARGCDEQVPPAELHRRGRVRDRVPGGPPAGANGLGPTPSEVAIKRMRESNERYTEEFLKEVIVLGRLSHPHLVRLHGYCMERDEALLVYEFMTGGCLHRALVDSANGELFFSWDMRLKVAVQIAEALAYMHGLNFIHRDLKAANVLLSPEYDAKLTDFGMVRVGPEGQLESIVSTRIMGTEGYIDPTYMETGHLGAKSDVYSFGVLLLELVTGRSVVDEGSKMVTECRTRFSDLKLKAAAYVDPKLGNQYPELGARTLATLARHCVAESRSSRPEISSVLEKLKMLVRACAHAEAKAAAKAAALAAGESGSGEEAGSEAEGAETEVAEANGVEEGPPPQSATAPV
ncbi:hypothetical protein CLOP_g69 [Closterium sp. NIES-67]|nr:hypothetical protein CLOP_g69 [Closterium sp. NIES-67]